ncbi:hypothetical protein [Sulfuracidifex tepidarius]|uniref:Uncharacterized protein n=1 Tax=Sulfuracidifex tepidarius TaxID=1294262 RepID=A0A510E642_9CREN|nr:hypothetical protein [Sulfuracidifex tepidarius]BBG27946.1 hypothetical protein IC007_2501 [Sulfuracidifex tepidarius]
MKFDDDFHLIHYTVSKLKYFPTFRKYKGNWGRKHGKSYFGFKVCNIVERKTNLVRGFKVGLANLSDLYFSFDGFKLMGDRAWASRKDVLVKGVSAARFPVEGSGIKIREDRSSSTTLSGVVIEVFFLNLYRDLEVLLARIRTKVLVN